MPHEHPLVRFGVTLAANVARAGLSFLAGVVVARGLGATHYGDLNFLLASFAALVPLLDVGTSSAFYTFLSRGQRGWRFFAAYFVWLAAQFAVVVTMVAALLPAGVVARVWVGQPRILVLLAFAASFLMTQAWGTVTQLGEALRRTALVQFAWVAQAAAHCVLVILVASAGRLGVAAVLALLVAEHVVLVALLGPWLFSANMAPAGTGDDDWRAVVREFAVYCAPLVVYGWVSFVCAFADRWFLQRFAGSQQQAYFSIGQQFGMVSLLATTSMLKVFWKEVTAARAADDEARVARIYDSASRGLYFVGAWMGGLLIPYSAELLAWTVGRAYEAAWLPLSLMLLFPIHQSLGQVTGTFCYATGQTNRYAKVGLVTMLVSIPVTYFVLVPPAAGGWGLGSVGLAAKMVVLQVLGVAAQRALVSGGWAVLLENVYQAGVLAALLALGFITKAVASAAVSFTGETATAAVMPLGVLMYAGISLAVVWSTPGLLGVSRSQLAGALQGMIGKRGTVVA